MKVVVSVAILVRFTVDDKLAASLLGPIIPPPERLGGMRRQGVSAPQRDHAVLVR